MYGTIGFKKEILTVSSQKYANFCTNQHHTPFSGLYFKITFYSYYSLKFSILFQFYWISKYYINLEFACAFLRQEHTFGYLFGFISARQYLSQFQTEIKSCTRTTASN